MEQIANQENLAREIVDAAFSVHSALGPGLLESVYEECLAHDLRKRNLQVERQLTVAVQYHDLIINSGFRMDILVGGTVIVEVKAVERVMPVHEAQILTYLKLSQKRLGLLINFNVPLIKEGIRRFIR